MIEKILQWDTELFIYLNSLGIEKYDQFWATITTITTWIPLFIIFGILFFWKNKPKEALYMCLTLLALIGFILIATDLTKSFFERLRPNNNVEISSIIRVIKNPSSFSFFSGHASSSFSITTLVVLFLRKKLKWSWLFYTWPILFALSRIYVGVHYPIDILVGAIVGILSAIGFYKLYTRIIVPCLGLNHL